MFGDSAFGSVPFAGATIPAAAAPPPSGGRWIFRSGILRSSIIGDLIVLLIILGAYQ